MKITLIELKDYIAALSKNALAQFQDATDFNVVVVQAKTIDIVGIHVFPPLGYAHAFAMHYNNLLGLGRAYQLWDADRHQSSASARNTKRGLKLEGFTLAQFGREALASSYAVGPSQFMWSETEIRPLSFPLPKNALPQALAQIQKAASSPHLWLIPADVDIFETNQCIAKMQTL